MQPSIVEQVTVQLSCACSLQVVTQLLVEVVVQGAVMQPPGSDPSLVGQWAGVGGCFCEWGGGHHHRTSMNSAHLLRMTERGHMNRVGSGGPKLL